LQQPERCHMHRCRLTVARVSDSSARS
jgi:hypothetical protein